MSAWWVWELSLHDVLSGEILSLELECCRWLWLDVPSTNVVLFYSMLLRICLITVIQVPRKVVLIDNVFPLNPKGSVIHEAERIGDCGWGDWRSGQILGRVSGLLLQISIKEISRWFEQTTTTVASLLQRQNGLAGDQKRQKITHETAAFVRRYV